MVMEGERRKTFSVSLPDSMYGRVVRLARHRHLRALVRVVEIGMEKVLPELEREYPVEEEIGT